MPWQWNTDQSGWRTRVWITPKTQDQGKSKWWYCAHPECVKALKDCGRRPQVNHPSKNTCDFCGLGWNSQVIEEQAQLTKAKESLRAKLAEGDSGDLPKLTKAQSRRQRAKNQKEHVEKSVVGDGEAGSENAPGAPSPTAGPCASSSEGEVVKIIKTPEEIEATGWL